jgi:hypothetical protein
LPSIDPRAAQKIQSELFPDERIYWAAMPDPNVIFHSDDWTLLPFSLLWCGFTIFWEWEAIAASRRMPNNNGAFMILWGAAFVGAGIYFVAGRFVYDAWLKRRTYYAATNRRVVILQDGLFGKRKTKMMFLEAIPDMNREGTDRGTIWFGEKLSMWGRAGSRRRSMSSFSLGETLVLADIDDVRGIEQLIADLRAKSRLPAKETGFGFSN